ncbi:hypothetical protein AWB80_00472 [Caballeronia pedi]|uniref:Uncharacterized protein n=1 Tax=Caballeronia pedi TaxID=1777141 RepID=A0A157Z901_9BURK|nr:hypothetical protein [Caballeronia pedi]SAK42022.1 hypothetical protein AWB80_00472 [Caballeronia pedi]
MNRPEYSLSLDSVICHRCNFVSPAEEDTCPSCGADRQGAIFTSAAETRAPSAAVPVPLDILDWDDSHWLQRMVRRRMLTSYPNFVEPGETQETQRKPARTGIAVLVGGVVASLAVGAYFYVQLDDNAPPASVEPGISVAGLVHERAAAINAEASRHASAMRSKAESTNAQAVAPASSAMAQANHARNERAPVAPAVSVTARPATETPTVVTRAEPRAEPRVAVASAPASASVSTLAAAAPVKPSMPAAPTTIRTTANPPAPSVAPSVAVAAAKPATPNVATSAAAPAGASIAAAAPSIKPATPAIASAQKPEQRTNATLSVAAKPAAQASEPPRKSTPAPTLASIEKPAAPPAQPVQEPLPAAVARSIAAAQQALASRDLAAARRHMRGLYANEPRSPEIQQLAAELSRQERARDSAMASARTCAANEDPACALRNARRAVALDPRNAQTQATLRRALAVQNETNTEYFRQASGIPKPLTPTMAFDGHWRAGTRHGSTSDDDARVTLFGWGVPVVSKGRGDAH